MKIKIAILVVAAIACVGGEGSDPSLYQEETKLYESMVHPVDMEKVAEEPVLVEELESKDETELVQAPFFSSVFRGPRAHLSNFDLKPHVKKAVRMVGDFVESANSISSAATLASYANAKRLADGKRQTKELNGGFGHKSKYSAEYSADNDHPNGIINPGFRHGPRNHEMDRAIKKSLSDDAERELKKKTDKLFGNMREEVGGLHNFFRL